MCVQDVLMQFTDFLVMSDIDRKGVVEDILAIMPPMHSLLNEIGLSVPVAFQLVRPIMRAALEKGTSLEDVPAAFRPWHPLSPDMLSVVQRYLPPDTWEVLSPQLVSMFWCLSLYDLSSPQARYDSEIRRAKDRYGALEVSVKEKGRSNLEEDKLQQKILMPGPG